MRQVGQNARNNRRRRGMVQMRTYNALTGRRTEIRELISVSAVLFIFFFFLLFSTHLYFRFQVVWLGGGRVVYRWWWRGKAHRVVIAAEKNRKHTCTHTDSCKHKHVSLTVSFSYAQTHLPNPALSAALFQRASGFKNK